MTAFLMFLAFLVGAVVGAEFSRKLRARLAAEVDAANDRADDAEAAVLRASRNLSDVTNDLRRAEGALAARIERDRQRGRNAARTRAKRREARELANERSDAAFDTVTDPDLLPPFGGEGDEGDALTDSRELIGGNSATSPFAGTIDASGIPHEPWIVTPPAQEAA